MDQNLPYQSLEKMKDMDRIKLVKNIFSSITNHYDFLNHFLSLNQDKTWRKRTISEMNFFYTNKFLDIATGTGDLALGCAKTYENVNVTGVDFVDQMLQKANAKIKTQNLQNRVKMEWADATNLFYDNNSFDVSAIAFGIRNIPKMKKALSEMQRVVVDGGQVIILELSTPTSIFCHTIYSFYLNGLLPKLARIYSRNYKAYTYLAESIMNFPTKNQFLLLMKSMGLKNCRAIPLTFGICTLYIGEK